MTWTQGCQDIENSVKVEGMPDITKARLRKKLLLQKSVHNGLMPSDLLIAMSDLMQINSKAKKFHFATIIIVVINTWPSEKSAQKDNSDITVIRVSDSFKWVMFMQIFELDVTVFNKSKDIFSFLLFSVCCFQ